MALHDRTGKTDEERQRALDATLRQHDVDLKRLTQIVSMVPQPHVWHPGATPALQAPVTYGDPPVFFATPPGAGSGTSVSGIGFSGFSGAPVSGAGTGGGTGVGTIGGDTGAGSAGTGLILPDKSGGTSITGAETGSLFSGTQGATGGTIDGGTGGTVQTDGPASGTSSGDQGTGMSAGLSGTNTGGTVVDSGGTGIGSGSPAGTGAASGTTVSGAKISLETLDILTSDPAQSLKTFTLSNMDGFTPQCGIFYGVKRSSGEAKEHNDFCIGLSIPTDHSSGSHTTPGSGTREDADQLFCTTLTSQNGQKTWNCAGTISNNCSFKLLSEGNITADFEMLWRSAASDQITVELIGQTSKNVKVYFLAFANLDNYDLEYITFPNTTVEQTYNFTFAPDVCIFLGGIGTDGTNPRASIGFLNAMQHSSGAPVSGSSTGSGNISSCAVGWFLDESSENASKSSRKGRVLTLPNSGGTGVTDSLIGKIEGKSLKLRREVNSSATLTFAVLALKGILSNIQQITKPNASPHPGIVTMQDVGFNATAVFNVGAQVTSDQEAVGVWLTVGGASDSILTGASPAPHHGAVHYRADDSATSDNWQGTDTGQAIFHNPLVANPSTRAHVSSLGRTPQYNFTDGEAFENQYFVLALG